jgi:hypothetical protein
MPHRDKQAARMWRRNWWNTRPDMRKKQNDRARRRARELRMYLNGIKTARGCVDCGYNGHPAALDFDHVSGEKALLVSFAKSKAQADDEIKKCEVRCSNCHRIRTWERRLNRQPSCKPDIFRATYEPISETHSYGAEHE